MAGSRSSISDRNTPSWDTPTPSGRIRASVFTSDLSREERVVASIGLKRAVFLAVAVSLALSATGCVATRLSRMGAKEEARGDYDKAVLLYAKLAALDPESSRWTIALSRTKLKASQKKKKKAKRYKEAGQLEMSIGELQQVVTLDPQNGYAQTELEKALICLLYTSDAADERSSVDLGGRRI